MHNDIRLFIGGKQVEFSKEPDILFNFTEKELRNPTIVKNSFSKSITFEGTPANDDVFGNIWNLERIQSYDNFNPIRKTEFELFVNGQLYEKGYCRLDKVTVTNNSRQYSITLYGGLGQFFYNLSYLQDDVSGTKKTLASLYFRDGHSVEPDLDFTIDKDTVYEAWGRLCGWGTQIEHKWDIINFAPCYNGIPQDFDADRFLINNRERIAKFQREHTDGGVRYNPFYNGSSNLQGYSTGEMQHELTEWETRDLRSWMQRPVVNMRKVIEACREPENNGGYEVKLDEHFFHGDNPYWTDAWMTLPLLKDLDGVGGGQSEEVEDAEIVNLGRIHYQDRYYGVDFSTSGLSSYNNIDMDLTCVFTPDADSQVEDLYSYRNYYSNTSFTLQGHTFVKRYEYSSGVIMQLFAFGTDGSVAAQSKTYLLSSESIYPGRNQRLWSGFYRGGSDDLGTEPEYEWLYGYWKRRTDGSYVFCDMDGNPWKIKFTFSGPADIASLQIKVKVPYGQRTDYAFTGKESLYKTDMETVPARIDLYSPWKYSTTGNHRLPEVEALDRVRGQVSFSVDSLNVIATSYKDFLSGARITKEKLLTTDRTPADYLISYCKLFGLYFYYDSAEVSEDPDRYPSGVVHIMDRDSFYTDETVNLEKLIDWDKKVEIGPALASSKWYRFDVEHIDSQAETEYKEQYGQQYGSQLLNTNYNFDDSTTDLYDGNVFKSGVMVLEKDKYFYKDATYGYPNYFNNGMTYSLFARNGEQELDTYEIDYPVVKDTGQVPINTNYGGYDAFPKLQSHDKENEGTDGSGVLLFFKGSISTDADYWLTDDVQDMVYLNGSTPCWILTSTETDAGGNRIARRVSTLPYFTRDLILFGQTGNIVHSWNFGHPQVTFVPSTYTTDGDSIYDKLWKSYCNDLYNVDSRKLTCYVRVIPDGRPWSWWMRRYYWFNNSIWVLNSIKDLNISSFGTTKMEFIKVQDAENYTLERIEYQGKNEIVIDQTTIGCMGGTITGRVIMQSGEGWFSDDYIWGEDEQGNPYTIDPYEHMHPRTGRGQSVTEFTFDVPANTASSPITWEIAVQDDFDKSYSVTFVQESCGGGPYLSIAPQSVTVSSGSGQTQFTVSSNLVTGITASVTEGTWSASLVGNVLTVSYPVNPYGSALTGTVQVAGSYEGVQYSDSAVIVQESNGQPGDEYITVQTRVNMDVTGLTEGNSLGLSLVLNSAQGTQSTAGITYYEDTPAGDQIELTAMYLVNGMTQISLSITVDEECDVNISTSYSDEGQYHLEAGSTNLYTFENNSTGDIALRFLV